MGKNGPMQDLPLRFSLDCVDVAEVDRRSINAMNMKAITDPAIANVQLFGEESDPKTALRLGPWWQ